MDNEIGELGRGQVIYTALQAKIKGSNLEFVPSPKENH